MSATTETAVWLAIKGRIESLPLSMPFAWPGVKFTPPSVAPYIRVGRVTSQPSSAFIDIGKPHTRTGFVILSLVYPLGQNESVYDQIAGQIANHFSDGTHMYYSRMCVTVTSYPHVQDGFEDNNGYWVTPVRIPWRCFA